MALRNRKRQRELKKIDREDEKLHPKNNLMYTDLTPYNALNAKSGEDVMISKSIITDPNKKVLGGYNTKKK
jgi:hypothetical protein